MKRQVYEVPVPADDHDRRRVGKDLHPVVRASRLFDQQAGIDWHFEQRPLTLFIFYSPSQRQWAFISPTHDFDYHEQIRSPGSLNATLCAEELLALGQGKPLEKRDLLL